MRLARAAGVMSARRRQRHGAQAERRRRRRRHARQSHSTASWRCGRPKRGSRPTARRSPTSSHSAPSEGEPFEMSVDEWLAFARRASLYAAPRARRRSMGIAHRLGLRARQDARRLLPDAGRHRVRHRQVARGGAVCRSALDGDEDGRPEGGQRVRGRDSCRVPGQDAGLQPLAVVQLGHDRHERRGDEATFPRSWASWDSSSTSSPTVAIRSMVWLPRSSRPR